MLEKVKEIVAENLGADINTLTEETSFKDDLGADSPVSYTHLTLPTICSV